MMDECSAFNYSINVLRMRDMTINSKTYLMYDVNTSFNDEDDLINLSIIE